MNTVFEEVKALCHTAKQASPTVATATAEARNQALSCMAEALRANTAPILDANKKDLENATANGVARVMLDRLTLSEERIAAMADAIVSLAKQEDPLARCEVWERPQGLTIKKQAVPFGVVAMIYEARPNVTADAAALAIKSGNAAILRGGKEAIFTNTAIVTVLKQALENTSIHPDVLGLVANTTRESADALLSMRGLIDLLIPRGGKGLIRNCVDNAKVPVIETGAGNCHVYVDAHADLEKALAVTVNAKCQRPSVCNAAESLLCHESVAEAFLPALYEATRKWGLELRGCPRACRILPQITPATEEDFYTEYNDYILSVKVVSSVEEAIAHINETGTKHSEAIITDDKEAAAAFFSLVDAAALYHNASTRFTDGGEFGFGAEIGISTQKMHARGPMGTEALTTVKYLVVGNGTVRT